MITEMKYALSSSPVVQSLESKAELGRKVVCEPSEITFKMLCVFVILGGGGKRPVEFSTQRRSQGKITHSQNKETGPEK